MEAEGMMGSTIPTEDITCGFGFLKGRWLQKFATARNYVFLYGLLGSIFSASYAYSGGIFTTIEKRFKIQSQTMGIVSVGNDFSQILVLALFSYYIGRGHRPRWLAVGIYTVVLFCFMNALLYFLYGPGQDALELTYEYGEGNVTRAEERKHLCQPEGVTECDSSNAELGPLVILFLAQLISGFGGSLYHTLGVSYMDDNIEKSKTPALISVSYFIKMLGPVLGYGLASVCLNMYISPSLTPKIDTKDPRWVGAFWIGWLILGVSLFLCASLIGLFPKVLPKAAERSMRQAEKKEKVEEIPSSLKGMVAAFKRLLKNKVLICKSLSGVFYCLGYLPYWIFMPKYIEVIYRQSAATANLITGFVGLVCSAVGILVSGMAISKFKPQARTLSMWNIIVKSTTVFGFIAYANLGCVNTDTQGTILATGELNATFACNAACNCEYVKYSPVCAYGKTYISPCHAGCEESEELLNGTQIFKNCSCVDAVDALGFPLPQIAQSGMCPVDCLDKFYLFLGIVCLLKLVGATSQTSNFLISMRSVDEQDKTVALGFGLTLITVFAFVPGPIFFGHLIDTTCLVWGKTCSSKGNCWLYDGDKMKFIINFTGIFFLCIGLIFAVGAWYYVKGVQIFDDEPEKEKEKDKKKYKAVNTSENIYELEKLEKGNETK